MRLPSSLLWASALPLATATCPPTGPVLPPPRLCAPGNLTASLHQSLQHLSNSSGLFFNISTTSFSVQITTPKSTFFEFHHTAPIRESSGVEQVNSDTVYRIASISKVVTIYSLLLQENINLDDPITNFVPELLAPGLEIYREITLRMLMSHIGGAAREGGAMDVALMVPPGAGDALGLPSPEFPAEYPTCDLTSDNRCDRHDLLATILAAGNTWKPGHRVAYSNLGISLLGYALENITGLSYDEVVAKYIGEPLGLTATGLKLASLDDAIVPVGMGAQWITMPMGLYNATGGLYSTPNDVARITRSILSHTLLRESAINAWLKPAVFTSSTPGSAVGAPWEIIMPTNLAHKPRMTEIYTKAGDVPGFGSYMALIPEYDVGITINAAGDDSSITTRFLLDLIVQDLVPRLEALARSQAEAKYAGEYVDADGDGSMVLTVDDGPGLHIESWTRNGVSILRTWQIMRPAYSTAEARAYPVGEGDRWQLVLDSGSPIPLYQNVCTEWFFVAAFRYAGLPIDEFTFEMDGGRVTGLRVPGTRQRFVKQ